MERSFRIALLSLAVSLAVLGIKYVAYLITGSVALYSDALESIVNVATAAAVFISIRVAAMPPDADHPYGHHKAEYISSVLVGALIIGAALAILQQAFTGFMSPRPLQAPWQGVAVNLVATLINCIWGVILVREGARHRSASLVADGRHLLTDVATSLGVLVAVVLVVLTGIHVLDSLIAGLVALHVLASGWVVIRSNASGLLDETAPPEELELISATIAANIGPALEVHDLRTRHAGRATFIDFHLVVNGGMSVGEAHDICDTIEEALRKALPEARTTIHIEPEVKAKHKGRVARA